VRTVAVIAACLALAACGRGDDADLGGVSPDEAQALNDAAEMLDAIYDNSRVEIPPPGGASPANAASAANAANAQE